MLRRLVALAGVVVLAVGGVPASAAADLHLLKPTGCCRSG